MLVDSRVEVTQEYYAGVTWDGTRKRPVLIFSDMGGIDIEEVAATHPDHVGRAHFSTLRPFSDYEAKQVIASVGVTGRALTRLTPILARLARLFTERDMTLAEINPLAQLAAAIAVAGQQHGMVVLDADGDGDPAGQALERHRVGARRRLAAGATARRCGGVGGGVRQRAGGRLHDHQALLAAPQRARARGRGSPRCCCPTTGSPGS